MDPKYLNIKSLDDTLFYNGATGSLTADLVPLTMFYNTKIALETYTVQPHEEGRIDLLLQSLYGEDISGVYSKLDVILYINGIDNPLSILPGMVIKYPLESNLDDFRYYFQSDPLSAKNIIKTLGVPNKSTTIDPNRKKYLESDYSLPPTVNPNPSPQKKIGGGNISFGGI